MKARCNTCLCLDYSFMLDRYEYDGKSHFCGLHGGETVDPNGEQPNLDRKGGCGYIPKEEPQQLELIFND